MDVAVLIFLSSGLFLGWSLGANDAANVLGTAVGTRMVRFTTAALICSVFVILGAVVSGAGAAHTLGKLGEILNAHDRDLSDDDFDFKLGLPLAGIDPGKVESKVEIAASLGVDELVLAPPVPTRDFAQYLGALASAAGLN